MSDPTIRYSAVAGLMSPIWIVLLATAVVATLMTDKFLSPENLIAVFQTVVIAGIVALGMNIVLIGGHFDLSVGAIVMMSAVIALLVGPSGVTGVALAIIVPILAGIAVGTVNGLAVYAAGANSIVATLGMQFLIVGGTLALVQGENVHADKIDPAFTAIAQGRFLDVPVSVLIFLALVIIVSVVMSATVFGRHVYAIGGDAQAAHRAGVKVNRTGVITFMVSGGLAAVSGIIVASLVGMVDPTATGHYELLALTAVVLGGTSLAGGIGRPADTAAAMLALAIVTDVMTINNYQYPLQLMVQGLLLTIAVSFYAWYRPAGREA